MFKSILIDQDKYEVFYNDRYVGNFERSSNRMWFFRPLNTTSGKSYTIKELGELKAHLMSLLNYN